MMHRLATSTLFALCLVLTSLAAVVAETRMAAAGGYCGTGAPQILLDQAGLPILDADGRAVSSAECPVCHLALGFSPSAPPLDPVATVLRADLPVPPALPAVSSFRSDRHARAPPLAA